MATEQIKPSSADAPRRHGATKKQRALERLKARRRKAVTGHKNPSGEFPSPHEVRDAILIDRS